MRVRSTVLSTLVLGLAGTGVNAAIVEHVGLNDPTTEATPWTLDSAGTGHVLGPIANDAGSGYDAWTVNDNSATGYARYVHNLTAGEQAAIAGQNWIAATRLRQPDLSAGGDGDVALDVRLDGKRFLVYFGTQADGNPTWTLYNDIPRAITGLGPGYHLYEMRYDDASQTIDFYVDNQLSLADYNGGGLTMDTPSIYFGSASGAGQDQGNYNWVVLSLDPVPEPATLSLVAMGALLGLRRRSR